MAYDEALAERVRGTIGDHPVLSERTMFGGLAFLIGGNMAVAVSGQGGLMVRVEPADTAGLLERPGAAPMVMRGKEMSGWLRVGADVLDDSTLQKWVDLGVEYAARLPAK
jgi:hypothetical protein